MPHVSLSWLRDHVRVPSDATIASVAEDLVSVGIEEEEIRPPAVTGPLVLGRVLTVAEETASNGKTVRYCRVDVGEHNDAPGKGKEPSDLPSRGIVCGAHNFGPGDAVVVSLPGAVLPGPFPIAARKTYGHISDGMICSEQELGVGADHTGIMVLDRLFPDTELPAPGTDLIEFLGLGEEVLEVNVTPDRGYAFSMRGLAREYSHATGAEFKDPGLPEHLSAPLPLASDDAFTVRVDPAADLEGRPACDRFVTLTVRGLDPAASSPAWMQERLLAAGMRPISLPVDVTNFVMLDLGQPLHAYALDKLAEPLVVRRAQPSESFTTLDGVDRTLSGEDIVISDSPAGEEGARIVGIAGVMGGLDSEVDADTTDVVIEGAHFDPVSVARTSRRLKLSSEASKRFERGVDPQLAPVAVMRTAQLIAQYGGGTIDEISFDLDQTSAPQPVVLPLGEAERLTGVAYDAVQQTVILESIGCAVDAGADSLVVTPPTWRPDLTGPAHLVEEIARIDGYDRIPTRVPTGPGSEGLRPNQWLRRVVAETAAEQGVVEVLSYPFIGRAHDRQLIPETDARRQTLVLRNPLAEDARELRTSLLDTLLDTAGRNASRGSASVAVFETGTVTLPAGTVPAPIPGTVQRPSEAELDALYQGVPAQPEHFAAVLGGKQCAAAAGRPAETWQWSDAIALGQEVAAAAGVSLQATRAWVPGDAPRIPGPPVPTPASDPAAVAPWHPGRSANLYARRGKQFVEIGRAGELHPRVAAEYGLPPRSAAVELDLRRLAEVAPDVPVKAERVSVYPPAKIDLALVLADHIPAADAHRVITSAAGPLLEKLELFDVYTGDQIPGGSRSLAYAVTLRAPDRTLSAAEVSKVRDKIIHDVTKRLGAQLRA